MPRETMLAKTLVGLADTLVDDFDVVELLTLLADGCVDVLDVGAAGLMLIAPEGDLRVMASSSEAMRVLELFEVQSQEGPCLDCYRTGQPVLNRHLATAEDRWPRFAPEALAAGFHIVHALPMRLRGTVIGALNLFHNYPGDMRQEDIAAAQAMADVATIAILQHRARHEAHVLNEQLNHALNSRIVIEQAKGMLAERLALDLERAFATLRNHARDHNLRLVDLARNVTNGTLDATTLDPPPPSPPKTPKPAQPTPTAQTRRVARPVEQGRRLRPLTSYPGPGARLTVTGSRASCLRRAPRPCGRRSTQGPRPVSRAARSRGRGSRSRRR
jgi:GAF domain-containing protein